MNSNINDKNEKMLRIDELKREKNAVIMAHYYVEGDVQEAADYIGDSYFLSETAAETDADIIVLCGVSFMGESAKILNPDKKVLLPVAEADCPMAYMARADEISRIRREYDDVAVVCYVNSTAELKAQSDVCVTSSNAMKIVKALPNKNIYFIPDQNLAHFIADQLPEKNFIFNDGYCPVHHDITAAEVLAAKDAHPNAPVLVHPECRPEVTGLSDYAGSTSGIIKYVTESDAEEFIIVTEWGILHELEQKNPQKRFYPVSEKQICQGMKKITLDSIISALETEAPTVDMEPSLRESAHRPMKRMLELSR